jgi:hypothetical protein
MTRNLSGGGFDVSKYTPFHNLYALSPSTSWSSILNIEGEGFISRVGIYTSSSSYKAFLRITIDDVIVHYAYVIGGNNGSLLNEKHLNYITSSTSFKCPVYVAPSTVNYNLINQVKTYPYVEGGNYGVLLPQDLYFSKSLLIETMDDTTAQQVSINVEGSVL